MALLVLGNFYYPSTSSDLPCEVILYVGRSSLSPGSSSTYKNETLTLSLLRALYVRKALQMERILVFLQICSSVFVRIGREMALVYMQCGFLAAHLT